MSVTSDVATEVTPIRGGWHIKVRDDGRYCIDVLTMLYNYRIVLSEDGFGGVPHIGIVHGWCYFGHGVDDHGVPRTMQTAHLNAMMAALAWDGYGAPAGYDKQAL